VLFAPAKNRCDKVGDNERRRANGGCIYDSAKNIYEYGFMYIGNILSQLANFPRKNRTILQENFNFNNGVFVI
jgi:hypothetical protein